MTATTHRLSGAEARHVLRTVLRNHPGAANVLAGRMVNSLTMNDLKTAIHDLGMDADGLIQSSPLGQAMREGLALPLPGPKPAPQPLPTPESTAGWAHEQETLQETTPAEPEPAPEPESDTEGQAIEAELQDVRGLVMSGGFAALDDRLRDLIVAARKPAEIVTVTVEVPVPAEPMTPGTASVTQAKMTGRTATWGDLFSVTDTLQDRTVQLWDAAHPDTPAVDNAYRWPQPQTAVALAQIARHRNVFMFGPAGTGKTEWASQLAARLGRPFALVSCDSGTDAATLVGMTVPASDGGVTWQDGQLTRAIQTPGCVICIDEPSVARPGALFVLQNVLANRLLFLAETGRRVPVAKGVIFLACDNTNGTGGGAKRGYTDTNRLNAAFLDRFGARVRFDYLPPDAEAGVLVARTGCAPSLAALLISAATTTRAAADQQNLVSGIGLRRLLAWAELLTDGVAPEDAFCAAILHAAPEADVETLRQQCQLTYDNATVSAALAGRFDPSNSN